MLSKVENSITYLEITSFMKKKKNVVTVYMQLPLKEIVSISRIRNSSALLWEAESY